MRSRQAGIPPLVSVGLALVLGLGGCQAGDAAAPEATGSPSIQPSATSPSTAPADPDGSITVSESGFGQQGRYVRAEALLSVNGGQGRFVTVHFNVYDHNRLVASGDHVEQVTVPAGRKMALGTQLDLHADNVTATAVKADLSLSDYTAPLRDPAVIADTKAQRITKSDFGSGYDAYFLIKNPTSQPWTSVRIGVVCADDAGKIIGGGSIFPQLVPAQDASLEKPVPMITSRRPSDCTAYPGG